MLIAADPVWPSPVARQNKQAGLASPREILQNIWLEMVLEWQLQLQQYIVDTKTQTQHWDM